MRTILPFATVCVVAMADRGGPPPCIVASWEACATQADQCACLGAVDLVGATDCDEAARASIEAFLASGCAFAPGGTEFKDDVIKGAHSGNVTMVEAALRENATALLKRTYFDHGVTAMMAAARDGHTDVVKLLLEKGANVHAQDSDGWTALMYAAEGGHFELTKTLLASGADYSQTTSDGKTAFDLAKEVSTAVDDGDNTNSEKGEGGLDEAAAALEEQQKLDQAKVVELLMKHSIKKEL